MTTIKDTKPKELAGTVVSDSMDKTVVVLVKRFTKNPLYGKYQESGKKYKAHDPENRFKVGDKVTIVATRPISKDKHFVVQYQ